MMQQTETVVPTLHTLEKSPAIRLDAVRDNIDDLVELFLKSQRAAHDFSSTINSVCERSGIMPSVLKKLVKAHAGDNFDKARQEVVQLALVFEEVGE
jgi:hypothetical protein